MILCKNPRSQGGTVEMKRWVVPLTGRGLICRTRILEDIEGKNIHMESKGKKRLLNSIMVLLILIIAASAVLTVGKIRGWFDKPEETIVSVGTTKGVVNIQRNGIGYTLSAGSALQANDIVETKKGAEVELVWTEPGKLSLNEKSQVTFPTCEKDKSEALVDQGEVFGDMLQYTGDLTVTFANNTAQLAQAVFSISVQSGSSSLYVFAGDVSVQLADGTQERVEAGEFLSVTEGSDDASSYQIQKVQAVSLNEFLINQAQNCDSKNDLCFTAEELKQVLDDRAAEKQAALEAALNAEKIPAKSEEESETDQTEETSEEETDSEDEYETDEEDADDEEDHSVDEYTSDDSGNSGSSNICTITIRCDTILDNLDNLDAGKEAYVPANGVILSTSQVEFDDGETVFDVLNRVCEYAGIQIEYRWTPLYSSYYIEGINNLYEFDCGNESGWMYKVNGWFPNYGCSSYTLENGDDIVWCYTCNGLGADVGGGTY